ncbi:hypothetical protein LCGC14_2274450 [marine sediment metagenome]|uniref:Uncharacterized protein n=1 Tax=marine sediment metagenome TaxID=412755 RepID=A0A0F9F8H5_9ZZZZ
MPRWIEGIIIFITLLRIARLIGSRLNNHDNRAALIGGLFAALGDGKLSRIELEALGADLGLYAERT